jgi:RNA polymerase sigma factor (sigma-70 family)
MVEHERKGERFPTTRHSIPFGLRSDDSTAKARSLDRLIKAYWSPVYKYLRRKWRKTPSEAEEITQAFFLRAIDKSTLATYDAERARFRTFIRACVDRFVVDGVRRDSAAKRGYGARFLHLDFACAEGEISRDPALISDPERLFEMDWAKSVVAMAVESLRDVCTRKGKEVHFRVFELFHLAEDAAKPSYAEAGVRFGLSVTDVTNRLSYARREFRALVLDTLRELTGNEEELRSEARAMLGVEL